MRNAAKEDVVKLIEFGRTLTNVGGQGELCATLLAAAAEIACMYEPNVEITVKEFTKSVHVVYQERRKKLS